MNNNVSKEIESKFFVPAKYSSRFNAIRRNKIQILKKADQLLRAKGIKLDTTIRQHMQKKHRAYVYFDLRDMQFYHAGISLSVRYMGKWGFGFTVKLPTQEGIEQRIEFDDSKSAEYLGKAAIIEEQAINTLLDFGSTEYHRFEHKNEKMIAKFVAHLRAALRNEDSIISKRLRAKGLSISHRTLLELERFEDAFIRKSLKRTAFNVYLETCEFRVNGKPMGYFTFDQVMDQDNQLLFYEAEVEINEETPTHLEIYKAIQKAMSESLAGIAIVGDKLSKYQRVVNMLRIV
ncbi:MAG: hypothetical protein KJ601_07565 [Nanoarchaeota archaeon]|nr:hypothetical protein [Nanoarchaeota archaeon]